MSTLTITRLSIPDVLLISTRRHADARGYFSETYRQTTFAAAGIDCSFVQDNESHTIKPGTIRGLHFQHPPHAQAKLVRVLRGAVLDVAVDLRRGSPTYGRWCAVELNAATGQQVFIPRGFAHGFCTLEPDTVVTYKVDAYYAPDSEGGVRWDCPDLAVKWPVGADEVVVSEKDAALPRLAALQSPFAV